MVGEESRLLDVQTDIYDNGRYTINKMAAASDSQCLIKPSDPSGRWAHYSPPVRESTNGDRLTDLRVDPCARLRFEAMWRVE